MIIYIVRRDCSLTCCNIGTVNMTLAVGEIVVYAVFRGQYWGVTCYVHGVQRTVLGVTCYIHGVQRTVLGVTCYIHGGYTGNKL